MSAVSTECKSKLREFQSVKSTVSICLWPRVSDQWTLVSYLCDMTAVAPESRCVTEQGFNHDYEEENLEVDGQPL